MNELLKNYSPEEKEFLQNNTGKEDIAQRVANAEKVEQLLKNSSEPSIEAKTLLQEVAENEEIELEIYVERGTAKDVFYKLLEKTGRIEVYLDNKNLETADNDGVNIIVANKEDQELLIKLLKNPVISFLISSFPDREFEGRMLEDSDLMPENTTKRVLIRLYEERIKKCDNNIKNSQLVESQKEYLAEKAIWQKKLEDVNKNNNFSAISDEELEAIMNKVIQEQLKNK